LKYLGWYHSHPRLPPLPSDKDLTMQAELQLMAHYCVGIIFSPYISSSNIEACYFNVFRKQDKKTPRAIRVKYALNNEPYVRSDILREKQNTLKVSLQEAKLTYDGLIDSCKGSKAREFFADANYEAFLAKFFKHSVTQSVLGIKQDMCTIAAKKLQLKAALREKMLYLTSKYNKTKDKFSFDYQNITPQLLQNITQTFNEN